MMKVDATAVRALEVDGLAAPTVEVPPGLSADGVLLLAGPADDGVRLAEVAGGHQDVRGSEKGRSVING